MESRIFCGQRALGYICNRIPVQIRYIKKHRDTFIIAVVGKRFHTFSATRLHLYSTSEFHPSDIECLAVDSRYVITACKEDIRVFKRGVEADFIHKIPSVSHLLLFGDLIVAVALNVLTVIARDLGDGYLELPFPSTTFEISCLAHPATYVNKILLGSKQGRLQLWNINSAQKIYEFSGWEHPIVCMEQSPALDIFAFGLQNGQIVLHNLKSDETLIKFHQEWGTVTGIVFRTDGPPLMITGSHAGHLAVWNLESKRIVAQKENCHAGPITGLKSFPTEPLLVTSSPDNSLRMWIMDDETLTPRLHKFREGHTNPPNRIRFYGESGSVILSAGKDSCIRSFSLEAEFLNFSLGKASFKPKLAKKSRMAREELLMPEITEFYAEPTREGEWDNVVAVHRENREVTTWSYYRRTKGSHRLLHERFATNFKVVPTCVTITACGNFCIIGYNTGHVDRFNIQSGIHRQAYGSPLAHNGSVSAVAPDGLNQQVFSAGETHVKFWKFKTGALNGVLETSSVITTLLAHRDNSLAAVVLENFSIMILDLDIRRIIRTFSGHQGVINDLAFSPDSRWLVSSSADYSIRVWDLSSCSLIDCFKVASECVSLTFSPTGEYLATAHQNDLGIFLWTNKTIFTPTTLTSIPFDSEPALLSLPGTVLVTNEIFPEDEEVMNEDYHSPEQLADKFLTLSLLPDYRWKNLARQDLIQERNKPKEPLKMPEKIPFFLPTVPGLQPKFDTNAVGGTSKKLSMKKLPKLLADSSPFLHALYAESALETSWLEPLEILKELSPSQIETEFRKLAPINGGSFEIMKQFLKCITFAVEKGRNQELVQSYVELFLKLHLSTIAEDGADEEFILLFKTLREQNARNVRRVEELLDQSLDVVTFLKHMGL